MSSPEKILETINIPHDKKKNIKLTYSQIDEIKRMYNQGYSIGYLADFFKVWRNAIHYHVDEQFRAYILKRSIERTKWKWANDPEYRKESTQKVKKWRNNRVKQIPIYNKAQSKIMQIKNPNYKNRNQNENLKRWRMRHYEEQKINGAITTRRLYRLKTGSGFRRFMDRFEQ